MADDLEFIGDSFSIFWVVIVVDSDAPFFLIGYFVDSVCGYLQASSLRG
jgi:hypothetical protein